MTASGHASGTAVVGVILTFTVLAVLCTGLRLYTRLLLARSAGWDDASITIAAFLSVVLTTTMCIQVKYGVGRHQDSLSDHEQVYALKWFWCSVWIYYMALGSAKFSILLQFLRIFPQPGFRKAVFVTMAVVAVFTLWGILSAIFACWPVAYFWAYVVDTSLHGKCLNRLAVWFFNASMNIATDIAIAVLPLPLIKSLNLPKRSRVALICIFLLGGVTCIVSLLRLQSLYAISITNDVSWENPLAAIWSSLEVNIGIMSSCLPTLKAGIVRLFPRFFVSGRGSASGHVVLTVGGGNVSAKQRTDKSRHTGIGLKYMVKSDVYEGPWRGEDVQCSFVQPDHGNADGAEGIHVSTIVQQESRRGTMDRFEFGDSESTRDLVRDES